MRNLNTFLSFGIVYLVFSGFVVNGSIAKPISVNLNYDNRANFLDFAILANNWQQSGAGLAGDFDDNNSVDKDDLSVFCWYWLTEYSEYQQCEGIGTDLDGDGIIAFGDLAKFAQNWLLTGSGLVGDFDTSYLVDSNDLSVLADCWLKGTRPLEVWGQFKAALANGNTEPALTFIADSSKDKYEQIFQAIGSNLPDFASGMGELTLSSQDEGTAIYEMTHQDGSTT
ncbi:MAG: hypothetical protein WCZ89_09470, partial [Phycisphaerae bacterium]